MLYAQVVLIVKDRQKAEDVLQDAYLAAWKGLGNWREDAGFIAWLQTIARNAARDALRREQRLKRGGPGRTASGGWKLRWERDAADEAAPEDAPAAHAAVAAGSGGLVGDVTGKDREPAEAVAANEAQERALAMLEELPEEYRRVLAMRYLAGADYAAIREQLGLTDGALRGLLNRGMALLRERMTRAGERT